MNLGIILFLIWSRLIPAQSDATGTGNGSPTGSNIDSTDESNSGFDSSGEVVNGDGGNQISPDQIPTQHQPPHIDDEPAPDDAILPPDIDLPTFNEHTEQHRSQAESPQATDADQQLIQPNQERRGKAKKNYAADSCGAKINKHAAELLNAHYLLKKNRDQYARTDTCKSHFDFTVELCEIIQLDQIQIGANEVFSSYPKEFKISAADADKQEWTEVGLFTASKFSPKAPPQTFLIDEAMTHKFVKFVRFEQISYQGEEQICTLTSFGVFGFGQYNPDIGDNPDESGNIDNTNDEGDPLKGIVKRVVGAIGGIFVPNSDKNDTVSNDADPNSASLLPEVIEDSYHDCWFHSAIFCYCDCTCHEFIGSPLFDVYVGPYNNDPPPSLEPPKSTLNSTDDSSTMTHQNETKTEAPQQLKKEDHLQSQIKEFQTNLSRVGEYLETLSISYKKQMNDMRTSFNRTAARLTKAESAVRDINENILEILSMIKFLYSEVNRIDTNLERTILTASIMIGFQIIMLLLWCRPRRDREVQGQLAKIEIQLDVLREMNEKVLKTHQQMLSSGPNQGIKGRRYTYDGHHIRSTRNQIKKRRNSFKINESSESVVTNNDASSDQVFPDQSPPEEVEHFSE